MKDTAMVTQLHYAKKDPIIISIVLTPVASCFLVCCGDQNITLVAGQCSYILPNLVTVAGSSCIGTTISLVSGPAPGTALAPGSYPIEYELLDATGTAIDDCSFTVTILQYPTPSPSLVCNDHVNISVDENCQVTLNADMFLEGNSYACYDSYEINIWPFKSKANAIKDVTPNVAISLPCGEHIYEIVDPATGNRCWGTFLVEDKIAPVVACNCEDKPVITPLTSFAGSLDLTDASYARPNVMNNPIWGLDHRIYIAGGSNGGEIQRVPGSEL